MTKYKFDKYYDLILKMKQNGSSNKGILSAINDDDMTLNKLHKIMYRLNATKKKYNKKEI